ncbi:hypothetical protein TNCV_2668591 [Trichonephila clavipes]|nr:hypothetical protein TNCV_2668591 [Trichonephila clavipes]
MTHTSNDRLTKTVLFAGICARKFARAESAITVQRAFHIQFGCQHPNDNIILRYYHQFEITGCLCKGKRTGRSML